MENPVNPTELFVHCAKALQQLKADGFDVSLLMELAIGKCPKIDPEVRCIVSDLYAGILRDAGVQPA